MSNSNYTCYWFDPLGKLVSFTLDKGNKQGHKMRCDIMRSAGYNPLNEFVYAHKPINGLWYAAAVDQGQPAPFKLVLERYVPAQIRMFNMLGIT